MKYCTVFFSGNLFLCFDALHSQVYTYMYMLWGPADGGYFSPTFWQQISKVLLLNITVDCLADCVLPVVIHSVLLLATLLSDMILFEKQIKGRVAYQL